MEIVSPAKVFRWLLNFQDWLYLEIRQSKELIKKYDLFENLDLNKPKIIKPSYKKLFSKNLSTLRKVFYLHQDFVIHTKTKNPLFSQYEVISPRQVQ